MTTRILLLFLSSIFILKGNDSARPRPKTMVTDNAKTLSPEARNNLEYLLVGRKDEQNCELFVLIEKLPDLPMEQYQTQLRNSGNQWSRNDWAILAHDPEKKQPPVIVAGGSFLGGDGEKDWSKNVALFRDLSSQNWSKKTNIEAFANRISDLLVFSSRRPHAEARAITRIEKNEKEAARKAKSIQQDRIIKFSAVSLAALAILSPLFWKLSSSFRKRRFPETQWSHRLEAPHSGGSSLNHKFPPVQF